MTSPIRHSLRVGPVALAIGGVSGAAFFASARDGSQAPPDICATLAREGIGATRFLPENDAAMKKISDMAVKPIGDVDNDFFAMMIPHHQGAIYMAFVVLRDGRNPQARRRGQEIIVTQQQEIAVMRLTVGEPLAPSVSGAAQVGLPLRPTDLLIFGNATWREP